MNPVYLEIEILRSIRILLLAQLCLSFGIFFLLLWQRRR